MRKLTIVGIAALSAALIGGRAEAQTPAQRIVSEFIGCATAAVSEPDAAKLVADHIPFNANYATPAQLADNAVPTPQEAATIIRVFPRISLCQQSAAGQLTVLAPTIGNLFSQMYADAQGDVVVLERRGMAYGSYVQRRQQRGRYYQALLQAEIARLHAAEQQQVQARQQASAAGDFITGLAKLAIGAAVVTAASRPQYVAPAPTMSISRPITCNPTGAVNSINKSITCW